MHGHTIDQAVADEIHVRDGFVCQACGALGEPRGAAPIRVGEVVPVDRGGSRDPINLLTLCEGCATLVDGDRPLEAVSVYLARYRALVARVAVAQGAAEGYVACCRALLDDSDERAAYRDARRELRTQCERMREGIKSVRVLPPVEWPGSAPLCEAHRGCLDRWEAWLSATEALVDGVDDLVRANHSGSYRCPECEAGVWLADEFCRSCGADFDAEEALGADVRALRRRLVRLATSLDGRGTP